MNSRNLCTRMIRSWIFFKEKHMENEDLYEKAMDSIRKLFSDRNVSTEKTIENMNGLRDEIEILLDSLGE